MVGRIGEELDMVRNHCEFRESVAYMINFALCSYNDTCFRLNTSFSLLVFFQVNDWIKNYRQKGQ